MTRYLQSAPFSVHMPNSKQFRDNFDAIFTARTDDTPPMDGDAASEQAAADLDKLLDAPVVTEDVALILDTILSAVESGNIPFQVYEFHKAFELPIKLVPEVPSDERVKLRLRLITEEFFELLESTGGEVPIKVQLDIKEFIETFDSKSGDKVDLVEFADALADLDYVIEGARLEFGIDGAPIADEVHRSNMAKLGPDGKPMHREDGKVIKPEGWTPPDIASCLREQGWQQ